MKMIIMRHMEVTASPNVYLGTSNVSLSEKGIRHAKVIAKKMRAEDIDAVYSSALNRSKESAEIIANELGLNVRAHVRELNELDFGVIEGLTKEEAIKRYPEVMQKRDGNRMNYTVPEGESPEDASKRALKALKEIARDNKGKKILIVMHGMLMRIILSKTSDRSLKGTYSWEFSYGCRLIYEINSDSIVFKKFIPE